MSTDRQFEGARGVSYAAGGMMQWSFKDAIIANAGGGQANAVQLNAQINNVTTIVTAGDSVKLPPPAQTNQFADGPSDNRGVPIIVVNSGANTLAVFPDSGSTINGLAANTSVNVAAGDVVGFWQTSAGAWFTADNTNKLFGNVTLAPGKFLFESAATGIVAGTTRTQAGATPLTQEINRVDTATAPAAGSLLGDGVVLPASAAGLTLLVWNNTNNPVQLYSNGSDTVNGVAGATGIAMPPNSLYIAVAAAAGSWMVDGTGMGNAGQYPTETAVDNLVAHAGGGQGAATVLPALLNRVTTVASAGDSVVLPASKSGMNVTVTNAAASNSMNVFPAAGEAINALGANAAFALAAGKTATFYCYTAAQWHSILSA